MTRRDGAFVWVRGASRTLLGSASQLLLRSTPRVIVAFAMGISFLLVDDDPRVVSVVSTYLKRRDCVVHCARSCAEAYQLFESENPELVLTDYELPDGTAFDLLKRFRRGDAPPPVIVLTGHGTIDLAVESIKMGAEHFLTKPVELRSLWVMIERVLERQRERRKESAQQLRAERGRPTPFVGTSAAIQRLEELAHAVLPSEAPVLILGPTGSGKGVLANWLHEHGPRAREAFVDLNCAGLSKELAESELFGHGRGSFTGAHASKQGLFEIAHRGTVFLDEIGDLEASVQPKVLKVLEDRTFRRLGETQSRTSDVRLISATHRDLGEMSRAGHFRSDLLFRINTVTFELPPLRERGEDVGPLATVLLDQLCAQQGRPKYVLLPEAIHLLETYEWPGNIRELRNVLERAVLFSRDGVVGPDALRFDRWLRPDHAPDSSPKSLVEVEREHILGVLRTEKGHVDQAAEILGVPRSSLYAKLKKYGIDKTAL